MPNDHDPNLEPPIAEPLQPASTTEWSIDDPDAPLPVTETVLSASANGGPGKLRVGVVAGAAVALAVGAVATSLAASPGQPASGATGATSATGAIQRPATTGGMPAAGSGRLFAIGPFAGSEDGTLDHGGRGMGFRDITITSISGNDVALQTEDGWTRTITVTDSMQLTKGGQTIALSDLKVGDQVRIDQSRNDDGTYTVNGIAVVVPSVHGTASAVTSSGFKVTTRDGSVWTITVNGSTVYQFGSGTGSVSDVTDGTQVAVQGTTTGDKAMTALTVRVAADSVRGTVKSTTSDTIVISKRDGSTVTVHVDSSTTYRVAGVENATLADIKADMRIAVSGRDRSDGSIDADAVMAGAGKSMGRGWGWFGGHGLDRGDGDGDGSGDGRRDAEPSASPSTS